MGVPKVLIMSRTSSYLSLRMEKLLCGSGEEPSGFLEMLAGDL